MFMDVKIGGCEFPSRFDCNTWRHYPTATASIILFCPLPLHFRTLQGLLLMRYVYTFFSLFIVGSLCKFHILLPALLLKNEWVHLDCYYLVPWVTGVPKRPFVECLLIKYILILCNHCVTWHGPQWFLNWWWHCCLRLSLKAMITVARHIVIHARLCENFYFKYSAGKTVLDTIFLCPYYTYLFY